MDAGIRYQVEGDPAALISLSEIQAELRKVGVGAWPLALDGAPKKIKTCLIKSA